MRSPRQAAARRSAPIPSVNPLDAMICETACVTWSEEITASIPISVDNALQRMNAADVDLFQALHAEQEKALARCRPGSARWAPDVVRSPKIEIAQDFDDHNCGQDGLSGWRIRCTSDHRVGPCARACSSAASSAARDMRIPVSTANCSGRKRVAARVTTMMMRSLPALRQMRAISARSMSPMAVTISTPASAPGDVAASVRKRQHGDRVNSPGEGACQRRVPPRG